MNDEVEAEATARAPLPDAVFAAVRLTASLSPAAEAIEPEEGVVVAAVAAAAAAAVIAAAAAAAARDGLDRPLSALPLLLVCSAEVRLSPASAAVAAAAARRSAPTVADALSTRAVITATAAVSASTGAAEDLALGEFFVADASSVRGNRVGDAASV